MNHIMESKDFFNLDDIKNICDKFSKSKYISVSTRKSLDRITNQLGLYDILLEKSEKINHFYNTLNSDWFDDILLEFFDGTGYTYKLHIGIYIARNYRFGYSDNDIKYTLPESYNNEEDKQTYLIIQMLLFISTEFEKEITISNQKYTDSKKDSKNRFNTTFGSVGRGPFNYFSSIKNIEPYIRVDVRHRETDEYYANYYGGDMGINGFTRNYFSYDSNRMGGINAEVSLPRKIINRLSNISMFGECVDVSLSDSYPTFAGRDYYHDDDGNYVKSAKEPILIHGSLDIKFKL